MDRTPEQILQALRRAGAGRLRRVVLRENRRTLWSLTRRGTALNLHVAYRRAPDEILEAFATIVREAARRGPAFREARARVAAWPELESELARIRRAPTGSRRRPCCATPAQRVYLLRLYRFLNQTRFEGRLPSTVPVRLSRRFSRRLGQMVPGRGADGRRVVTEIALDVDLMLLENDAQRLDTLIHEMAHAAHYLFDGEVSHGPGWRRWARRAGCTPRARCDAPIARRRRREDAVIRVPALPPGWRGSAQARPRSLETASTTASAVMPNRR